MLETAGPVFFAAVDQETTDSTIVAGATAQAEYRWRFLGGVLSNNDESDAASVTIEDEDGELVIGPIRLAAGATVILPINGIGYGETPAVNKAMHIKTDVAVPLGGNVVFQRVK